MSCAAKRTRSHSQKDNSAKRFKVDLNGLNGDRTTADILNLNDDCLEKVFSYLSRNDLVNVSETNSRFTFASERAFTRKYGKVQTTVSMIQNNRVNADVLKSSLKLLKKFGHLITKLLVEFKLEELEELLESIKNHCGEKINELKFCHYGVSINRRIQYNNGLEKMDLFLRGLNDRFTNLHNLEFDYRHESKICPYIKSVARPIASLNSFTVAGALFSLDDIRAFIDSNGHLECLTLNAEQTSRSLYISQKFIQYLDTALPQLKNFKISRVCVTVGASRYQEYPNRFQNLKKFSFGSSACFTFFHQEHLSFFGENIEDIELFIVDLSFAAFTVDSRLKKLKRLVLHLMKLEGDIYNVPEYLYLFLFWSSSGIPKLILDNNQLTEIVIHLYRYDVNHNATAYEDLGYLDIIKSKLDTDQWDVNEDAKSIVISKFKN